jgi:hypothetical protein
MNWILEEEHEVQILREIVQKNLREYIIAILNITITIYKIAF